MNEELKRALEEIEKDFLEDEPQNVNIDKPPMEEDEFDALLAKILAENDEPSSRYRDGEPAFEDPDKLDIPDQPVAYYNYSNDYGNKQRQHQPAYKEDDMAKKRARRQAKKNDKWSVILMGIASALCVGIIAVLVYWLEAFLK